MGSVDRGNFSSCVDPTENPRAWVTSPHHRARDRAAAVSRVRCD